MSSPSRTIDRVVFVFSANSGVSSAAIDSAKKVLQLRGCALCSITHGRQVLIGPDVLARCKGSVADLKGRLQTYAAMHDLEFPAA